MAGIDKVGESISKKLTLQDYKTEIPQEVNTAKQKKVKLTIYLTEDAMRKLNEICSKNVLQNGKQDKSALMSKAVDLLYEAEKK